MLVLGGGLFLMSELPMYVSYERGTPVQVKPTGGEDAEALAASKPPPEVLHPQPPPFLLLLSSLELSDTNVYEPEIRARLETAQTLNPEP